MEKYIKRIKNWCAINKRNILVFAFGVLVGIFVMSLFWPERIAKLKDGTESVVKIDNKTFTADDLYTELKDNGGLDAILNLVDLAILNEKYDLGEESEEYAKEQAESIFQMYETTYGYTKEEFLKGNNFKDEEEFLQYLKDDYLYQKYYQEYLESLIIEKDIKDYYKNTVDGMKKVYIFSSTSKDNDLTKVKKALEKGKTYEEIEKKYTDIICNDLGEVNFNTYSNYSEEFLKQLKKLDAKEASSIFTDDTFGYAVIYVTEAEEKKEYDEIKDEIKKVLAENKSNEDDTLYYKGFIKLRDEHNIKFYDTSLKKSYDEYLKQYK